MIKRLLLPAAILVMGLVYIFVWHGIVFKLIPMCLILIFAYFQAPAAKSTYTKLILSGLFFCMLGDGLLHWFIVGLTAFLIGHLFYLSAFTTRWQFSAFRLCLLIPLVCYAVYMGWKLHLGLESGGHSNLSAPIILYMIAIMLMGFFAIMSGNLKAAIGALLFVISDSILSWNMFISKVSYSEVLIMSTYYTAQFLIAGSIPNNQRNRSSVDNQVMQNNPTK